MSELSIFDHVGLNVADLAAMTRWYTEALDLKIEFEFSLPDVAFSGAMLASARGYRIELLHRAGNRPGLQPTDPVDAALRRGYGHFALDVADVDVMYDGLVAAGASDRMSPSSTAIVCRWSTTKRSSPSPAVVSCATSFWLP